MKVPGIQIVAELTGCNAKILDSHTALEKMLHDGIAACGLHQVNIISHKFTPIGVTAIAIISESHIAIHTYPEAKHASVDIFHCADDATSLHRLLAYLQKHLEAQRVEFLEFSRGSKLDLKNRTGSPNLRDAKTGCDLKYRTRKTRLGGKSIVARS